MKDSCLPAIMDDIVGVGRISFMAFRYPSRKTKRCGSAVELQAGDGDIRFKFFPDGHDGDPLEIPSVQFGL